MSSDIAIKVENLSKKFPLRQPQTDENGNSVHELWALKDVSFEIKKGESVGIIGHNGSGKSTLLKILAGVSKPTSGSIQINGRVASILDIGAGFHAELSGRENVFLSGQTLLGCSREDVQKRFDEIVAFSGIEKFIDEPVKNYSNGMYLRLAFSIMAHLDFDVYLFDEVFSVGDAEFALKTRKKFQELLQSEKTILLVSHNIPEVSKCSIFLMLDRGGLSCFSRDIKILSSYITSTQNINNIHRTNVTISDFPDLSDEVKIKEIRFSQNNDFFRTNKPFIFEIDYEKLKDENTLDVILQLSDLDENVLFITSPFITNDFSQQKKKGHYGLSCTIPENILNAQVYSLGVIFYKNAREYIDENFSEGIISSSELYGNSGVVSNVINVIYFKPEFSRLGETMDLNFLKINAKLLAGFRWQIC